MRRILTFFYSALVALMVMACSSETPDILPDIDDQENESQQMTYKTLNITINGQTKVCTLADNSSVKALVEQLAKSDLTYEADDYGNFEKVGSIGITLPQNNESITTTAGDIILYQGTSICLYYGVNTWSFTRIGKIEGISQSEMKTFVNAGGGSVKITLSLPSAN